MSVRHLRVTSSPSVTGTAGLSRITESPERRDGLVPPKNENMLQQYFDFELTGHCNVYSVAALSGHRLTPVHPRVCWVKGIVEAGGVIPYTQRTATLLF